jgi:hypothetical protein
LKDERKDGQNNFKKSDSMIKLWKRKTM